jgi:hypothetical protein
MFVHEFNIVAEILHTLDVSFVNFLRIYTSLPFRWFDVPCGPLIAHQQRAPVHELRFLNGHRQAIPVFESPRSCLSIKPALQKNLMIPTLCGRLRCSVRCADHDTPRRSSDTGETISQHRNEDQFAVGLCTDYIEETFLVELSK